MSESKKKTFPKFHSDSSFKVVYNKCINKSSCSVRVSDSVFGNAHNPPGIARLAVEYSCGRVFIPIEIISKSDLRLSLCILAAIPDLWLLIKQESGEFTSNEANIAATNNFETLIDGVVTTSDTGSRRLQGSGRGSLASDQRGCHCFR